MRFKPILAATGSLLVFLACLTVPAIAQNAAPVKPVCANCHEAQWNAIDLTAHGAKSDANGSTCQSCHGDAAAHLANPMTAKPDSPFRKGVPAAKQAEVCLTCHSGNRNLAFWTSGKHALNDVACTNCHSIHGKTLAPTINKFVTTFLPNQADGCGTCHQQIRAATFKPSHHPIIEGKVKCSDCHNPHGALSPAMIKQPTINDQCYSCHADKRGPYVFNHPPVEENCAICHNPHGSVHMRLRAESLPGLPRLVAAPGHGLWRGRRLCLPAGIDDGPEQRGLLRQAVRLVQLRGEQPTRVEGVRQLPHRRPRLERAG
jgi:DmsE family decaheme c-type cytochrome